LALKLVADAIFYGAGNTSYMACQAIITDGTVHVAAFILYLANM